MAVHNQLQVILHEAKQPHPLVPEIYEMVVAQMRWLGLTQFIDVPNVEISGAEARSLKNTDIW